MDVIVQSFCQIVRKAYTGALHGGSIAPSGDIGVIDECGDDGADMADNVTPVAIAESWQT